MELPQSRGLSTSLAHHAWRILTGVPEGKHTVLVGSRDKRLFSEAAMCASGRLQSSHPAPIRWHYFP